MGRQPATPSTPTTTLPMARETLTLVGRASGLAFTDGVGSWTITINRGQRGLFDFSCVADSQQSIDGFELMDEGMLIGVIAEHRGSLDTPLKVQRLELLGKPRAAEVTHG